jgi:uncharacterized damage-inducible protein DinB
MDLNDLTVIEESLAGDEIEMLTFALNRARAQFAWKCGGLDAAGLGKRLPPSAYTLGGLVRHLAFVEESYRSRFLTGEPLGPPWAEIDSAAEPDWVWHDSPEELYALWRGAVERSQAAWARALAAGGLDQPSTFTTETGEHPNLRRVLVDTIEEYIRHTGHADLLREAVDGLVGTDPPQP